MDDSPHLRQPTADEQRHALSVLLTGRGQPQHPSVDHFIRFAEQQKLSLEGLWAAYRGQTPVYTALIIPGAGRTAVMFISPIQSADRVPIAAELVQEVIRHQSEQQMCLIQTLLEPTQQYEEQALQHAGFTRLASLVYMRRSCLGLNPSSKDCLASHIECDGRTLTRLTWRQDRFDVFAHAINRSYLDTLDCPGLVGVRQIEDIIAGHRAVGRFEPELWSAYYMEDEPAAVMLLNPLIERSELELVYLGLSPAFRGRGLASRLMKQAFATAHARHDAGIHLAVDQENTPAMNLYKALGFRASGRKAAMIYVLK